MIKYRAHSFWSVERGVLLLIAAAVTALGVAVLRSEPNALPWAETGTLAVSDVSFLVCNCPAGLSGNDTRTLCSITALQRFNESSSGGDGCGAQLMDLRLVQRWTARLSWNRLCTTFSVIPSAVMRNVSFGVGPSHDTTVDLLTSELLLLTAVAGTPQKQGRTLYNPTPGVAVILDSALEQHNLQSRCIDIPSIESTVAEDGGMMSWWSVNSGHTPSLSAADSCASVPAAHLRRDRAAIGSLMAVGIALVLCASLLCYSNPPRLVAARTPVTKPSLFPEATVVLRSYQCRTLAALVCDLIAGGLIAGSLGYFLDAANSSWFCRFRGGAAAVVLGGGGTLCDFVRFTAATSNESSAPQVIESAVATALSSLLQLNSGRNLTLLSSQLRSSVGPQLLYACDGPTGRIDSTGGTTPQLGAAAWMITAACSLCLLHAAMIFLLSPAVATEQTPPHSCPPVPYARVAENPLPHPYDTTDSSYIPNSDVRGKFYDGASDDVNNDVDDDDNVSSRPFGGASSGGEVVEGRRAAERRSFRRGANHRQRNRQPSVAQTSSNAEVASPGARMGVESDAPLELSDEPGFESPDSTASNAATQQAAKRRRGWHGGTSHRSRDASAQAAAASPSASVIQWKQLDRTGLLWSDELGVTFNPRDGRFFDPNTQRWYSRLSSIPKQK